MEGVIQYASELPDHLPKRDYWKTQPEEIKKFYAPTDDRGFVLPEALIEKILDLFDDDYRWPVNWSKNAPQILRPDDHHFHWIARNYERKNFSRLGKLSGIPMKFRELPTQRGLLPRQFHNTIHELTLPPDMPKIGHMEHYCRSFAIAKHIFETAERALGADERFLHATEDKKIERYMQQFDKFFGEYVDGCQRAMAAKAMETIGFEAVDLSDMTAARQRLGSCALHNIPNYTPAVPTEYTAFELIA